MNRTCLHDLHQSAGARMIDFGGWHMPVVYTGIIDEHRHTRSAASLFDVSHMGRLEFHGPDAEALLQSACTRNVARLAVGRCGYSHVCNERGGVRDDVIVSRYADHWLMVCNASNREKIVAHLGELMRGMNVRLVDRTLDTAMIAVQGPRAWDTLRHLPLGITADPAAIRRYAFVGGSTLGVEYGLFRTGYTGEDGFEIVVPAAVGPTVWNYLLASEQRGGPAVRPAGLGARDTLRLEAGMPLYGHELGEEIDSISSGCGWCVDLNKDFVGAAALRRVATDGPKRKLVGLNIEGKRIARQGTAVLHGSTQVGEVTSGTLSPTLDRVIAMAYVDAAHAAEGTALAVDLRGEPAAAVVGPLVFYKRAG
ncbi:MAG: glycine cleavage system aminomethyltransferase GcvT [Phycisphaerae bacterium]|nr:glycine cleavage system aminomethyltransferase GcvT [Phycisphaerae bacterium]NUQ47644.1 glycine cleavage system aminomethyltransferase GcvT [Phycisphaerae bacterium]